MAFATGFFCAIISSMLSLPRRLLKLIHPQGIPIIASSIYNFLSTWNIFQKHYELVANDISEYLPIDGKILDIGTGPAWLLIRLNELNPSWDLTGVDISPAMIQKATMNIKASGKDAKIKIQLSDSKSLPYPDNNFDIVVSTLSIHHWKGTTASINEIYRVLKPAGTALIYDIASDTPKAVLDQIEKDFGKVKRWLFWLHAFEEPFYSQNDFLELATPTKFKSGKTKFVGMMFCLILKK